jgi:lysophospholipase L1-like esterase
VRNHTSLSILFYFIVLSLFLVNCTLAVPKKNPDNRSREQKSVPVFMMDGMEETKFHRIGADNPGLYYTGRIDDRDPTAPVIIWQGTEVRARFTGKRIGLTFSNAWGQNFYNVIIDGRIWVLKLNEWGSHDYLLSQSLPEGVHELILFKRTEAYNGSAVFGGLILEKGAKLGEKPQPLPLRIEFYGDSITAGACDENPPDTEQYDDLSTHNNYSSYGAITARNLDAEYICIAVSGIGVCNSWNPLLLPEIYDRLYLVGSDESYDFRGRKPDIVVLNVGQNDFGFTKAMGKEFPTCFTEKYVEWVRKIRGLYPDARIVCSIGGMSAYNDSPELRTAYEKAVDLLKTTDPKIYRLVFTDFTYNHPRVDTHAKMAVELTAFLQKEVMVK